MRICKNCHHPKSKLLAGPAYYVTCTECGSHFSRAELEKDKQQRIEINADRRCPVQDGYAIQGPNESPVEAVIRSIERRTGKHCYTHSLNCYNPFSKSFNATFVSAKTGNCWPVAFETVIHVRTDNGGR